MLLAETAEVEGVHTLLPLMRVSGWLDEYGQGRHNHSRSSDNRFRR